MCDDARLYDQAMTDAELARVAQDLVWQRPDADVLNPALSDQYSSIALALQDCFRSRHQRGTLILPDLKAYGNRSIGLFSDYSGEGAGDYHTYCFLTCALETIELFERQMAIVREQAGLGEKEIAFKDLRMGQMRRALPGYLRALDMVPGFLFTVVVDKRLSSLFGTDARASQRELVRILHEAGLGTWKLEVAEKLLRIVHIGAFLIGLLAVSGQRVLWMTDQDAICANSTQHEQALALFTRVLRLYTAPGFGLEHFGGAVPFATRDLGTLDLLSITDLTAGSIEHYLTRKDKTGRDMFEVKDGAQHVLQWLAHDSIGMKKMSVVLRPSGGGIRSGSLEISLADPGHDAKVIPVRVS